RTQPLVVAPQRTTELTFWLIRIEARLVPKNPEAPFLSTIVSSSRGSRRGSISTQRPPICSSLRLGTFWSQSPPSFRLASYPIVVKTTGSPLALAASGSRFVGSTAADVSAPGARSRSVNPQLHSTTRSPGREPRLAVYPAP